MQGRSLRRRGVAGRSGFAVPIAAIGIGRVDAPLRRDRGFDAFERMRGPTAWRP